MCIIILNKKEKEVVKPEWLKESARRNSHGAGIAWAAENKIHTFKSLDADSVISKYYDVAEEVGTETDILLHFRIKTHGSVDVKNIHPFVVNKGMVMAHNGTITIDIPKDEDITDSETFARLISKFNFWNNPNLRELMAMAIGRSKLVFLNRKGNSLIINEDLGEWAEGNWFSNTSYKPFAQSTGYYSTSYNRSQADYIDNIEDYDDDECAICGTPLSEEDYLDGITGFCSACRRNWGIDENNYNLYLY